MTYQTQVLNAGSVTGELLVLDEPLSFWGGYDPETGTIIDQQHPQVGVCVTGKVLVLPATRGSSGTPGVLGESLRLLSGPIGLILGKPDVNVMAAALVVSELYGQHVPVLVLAQPDYGLLRSGATAHLGIDGDIHIAVPAQ